MSLKVLDLFCGAGGLSKGLEMVGMKIILGVDFDKAAMKTFKKNHPDAEVYVGDISSLNEKKLVELIHNNEIDVVCGGPPCQGMSTVGEGIPDDPRNFLFKEFLRIVKMIKPKYIIIENVTGMLSRKNEKILKAILREFEKIGYSMSVNVLQASDYGVPQKRRRTIFIGNRLGYENIFPQTTHGKNMKEFRTVGDALSNLKAPDGNIYNHNVEDVSIPDGKDKERLKHIPEGRGIRYPDDEKELLPEVLHLGINWRKVSEGRFRQTKYHRLDRNKPSPTIMTGRYSYYHPTEHRFLTPREAAAIQSFPNDFVFEGTLSQQFRQIGNAVPPVLAKAIGEAIIKMDQIKSKSNGVKPEIDKIRYHAFNYKSKDLPKSQSELKKFET